MGSATTPHTVGVEARASSSERGDPNISRTASDRVTSLRERVDAVLRRTGWRSESRPDGDALAPRAAELFSVSQLEEHARALAARHRLAPKHAGLSDSLLPRLAANAKALREAHTFIMQVAAEGTRITPAAEWFVDNYHIIEEQIRTARRHLPRAYNRELPRLVNARAGGMPRVYDIVLELISHSEGRVDIDGLRAFVTSYQTVSPLQLGELWAIPIMLRLALIEGLRRIVLAVTEGRADRTSGRQVLGRQDARDRRRTRRRAWSRCSRR